MIKNQQPFSSYQILNHWLLFYINHFKIALFILGISPIFKDCRQYIFQFLVGKKCKEHSKYNDYNYR